MCGSLRRLVTPERKRQGNSACHEHYDVREALAVVTDPSHAKIAVHLSAHLIFPNCAAVIAIIIFVVVIVIVFILIVIVVLSSSSSSSLCHHRRQFLIIIVIVVLS